MSDIRNPESRNPDVQELVERRYRHGFITDIEADTVPPGLDRGGDLPPGLTDRCTPSSCGPQGRGKNR